MASNLDQQQIMQLVFNQERKSLMVDANVVATVLDTIIRAEHSDIAIKDPVSGHVLKINDNGSINSNIVLDAAEDNILIMGSENGSATGTKRALRVDSQGNSKTLTVNNLIPFQFDGIFPSYPDDVTELFTYKQGGITVATVTVIYVDNTKNEIVSVVRS